MRLGLFGARGDKRGLATLTADFARNMAPDKILGIEVPGSPYPNDWSGFEDIEVVPMSELSGSLITEWLSDVDAVYFAETGYHEETFNIAWNMARTFLHAMPEFYPWDRPTDVVANPTTWLLDRMPGSIHFPCPIDTVRFPFTLREEARVFLHVVGHPAMKDRNGTRIVLDALPYLDESVEIVIRSRQELRGPQKPSRAKVRVEIGDFPDNADLYAGADVLILPRRYGGLSLPMQEAASLGMPVVTLDREPERGFIHDEMRIPATHHRTIRTQGGPIDVSAGKCDQLAGKMLELARNPALVAEMSKRMRDWAESISWEVLRPQFRELLGFR